MLVLADLNILSAVVSPVLIHRFLDLRDKLLKELYLLLHGTQIGSVALKLKLPSLLCHLHLFGLFRQLILHVLHLAVVYLLHLLVLVLDDGDVFLLRACLNAELLGVLLRALLVLIAHLLLLGLGLPRDLPDLVPQTRIVLPHRLRLLLDATLVRLVVRHQLNVVTHDLVVKDLLLLQLLENLLYLLSHLEVANSLLFFIVRAVISHLKQYAFIVNSLLLNLTVKAVHLRSDLR